MTTEVELALDKKRDEARETLLSLLADSAANLLGEIHQLEAKQEKLETLYNDVINIDVDDKEELAQHFKHSPMVVFRDRHIEVRNLIALI